MDFKMITIFSFMVSTFATTSGAPQLTCPSQTVSAEQGGKVTVRVSMDPPTDLTDDRVNVKRAELEDLYVHVYDRLHYYNRDRQAAEYKDRTSVSEEDLIRGGLDLEIRNLSLQDTGSYRVSSSKHGTSCTFSISVARSQTETLLKTVLPVLSVFLCITAAVIYLWTSGRIRKVWPRVGRRVCLISGGSKGQDPDPEGVQRDVVDPQDLLSSV